MYFSEGSTYFSGRPTHLADLAKYLGVDQKSLNESLIYFSDHGTTWEVLGNCFSWLARHSAKLARYFSDLPIESEAFANHFCIFPSHFSRFARQWAEPGNRSEPFIRAQADG